MQILTRNAGGGWMILVLRLLLAAFFLFMAGKNLAGDQAMAADFTRWGYPPWFRVATACLQTLGALCLLVPALVLPGAVLLTCILGGAAVTHLRFDPLQAVVSPAVFLVLMGCLIVSSWPRP